jgi:hypothetical protein
MCRNWHNGITFRINITDTYILSKNSTWLKQNNILPGLLSEIEGLNTNQTHGFQSPKGSRSFLFEIAYKSALPPTQRVVWVLPLMKKGPQRDSRILSTEIQNVWNYSSLCVCFSVVFRHKNNSMYIVTIGLLKQQYKTFITIGFIAVLRLVSSMWILQTVLQKSVLLF